MEDEAIESFRVDPLGHPLNPSVPFPPSGTAPRSGVVGEGDAPSQNSP